MLALANGSLIEMHTPRHWALTMKNLIKKNKPPEGKVQMLLVTEKQFSKMDYIIGENSSNIIDSDDTLIIL